MKFVAVLSNGWIFFLKFCICRDEWNSNLKMWWQELEYNGTVTQKHNEFLILNHHQMHYSSSLQVSTAADREGPPNTADCCVSELRIWARSSPKRGAWEAKIVKKEIEECKYGLSLKSKVTLRSLWRSQNFIFFVIFHFIFIFIRLRFDRSVQFDWRLRFGM